MTATGPGPAEFRAAFPVAGRWIYFNHAAVAPLSLPVAKAIAGFVKEASLEGSTRWQGWLDRRDAARVKAARLLGARPEEIAFTTSTSQGLITVAEGLPLHPDDEVLVVQDDFPANHIPWFRQERRGARVVVVPRTDGRVRAEAILERVSPRTAVVAVPSVLYDTGYRLDLEAIGAGLAGHRAAFCVDAIQSLGAFPLDVEAARVDFLSADAHKWLLGPEGVGIFYCRRERLDELDPPFVSWLSMAEPFRSYERGAPLRDDAARFEYATMPTVAVFGLDAALDQLLGVGVDAIAGHVLHLTDALAAGLAERGWTVTSPRADAAESSGIVAARHPRRDAAEVVAALTEAGVSVAHRLGQVRFSPHGWNDAAEVDRVLELLPAAADATA